MSEPVSSASKNKLANLVCFRWLVVLDVRKRPLPDRRDVVRQSSIDRVLRFDALDEL